MIQELLSGSINQFPHTDLGQDQDISRQFQKYTFSRFHYASKQSQDITLVTDEGDRVSIQKAQGASLDYLAFDYTEGLKDKMRSVSSEEAKLQRFGSFEISVEGDLSQEEMKDIQKVLKGLDQVMKDLKSGNLEEVLKQSTQLLKNRDTLSSLEAVLQFSQELEIQERRMVKGLDLQSLSPKPVNLLDFIERLTEKVEKYLKNHKDLLRG